MSIFNRILSCYFSILSITLILSACNNDNNSSMQSVIDQKITPSKTIPDKIAPIFDIDKLPKSSIVLTANQSNDWLAKYAQYNLALADITFTITVNFEGEDRVINFSMNRKKGKPVNTDDFIPLDLTYLPHNQYALLHAMEIPAGKITAMTLSFSAGDSKIQFDLPPSPSTPPVIKSVLVDPFFSSYQKEDKNTQGKRQSPAELVTAFDMPVNENLIHYINIDINKNMTAGLDPFFSLEGTGPNEKKYQYIQFIPTAQISAHKQDLDIPIIVTSEKPLQALNRISSKHLSQINAADSISPKPPEKGQYFYITAKLTTGDSPNISDYVLTTFKDLSELEKYQQTQYNKVYKKMADEDNKVFLRFRDSLSIESPQNTLALDEGSNIPILTPTADVDPDSEAEVVFDLPNKIIHTGATDSMGNSTTTQPQLYNTNIHAKAFTETELKQLKQLKLPLNQDGHFVIVNSGKGNVFPPAVLPDEIQTFNNSTHFYKALKKLNSSGDQATYRILMLDIEGEYTKPNFTVGNSMKVIITGAFAYKLAKSLDYLTIAVGSGIIFLDGIGEYIKNIDATLNNIEKITKEVKADGYFTTIIRHFKKFLDSP